MEIGTAALDTFMYRSYTKGEGSERVNVQVTYGEKMEMKEINVRICRIWVVKG